MKKSQTLGLIFALFCLSCLACRGDGGEGLTAASFLPKVNGTWTGDWETNDSVFRVVLKLDQEGSRFSGSLSVPPIAGSFPISGSVENNLKMHWTANTGGCGVLTGDGTADSLSPSQINGTIDFNTLGCSGNHRFIGPVVWRRASSLAVAPPSSGTATLTDLEEVLEKELN